MYNIEVGQRFEVVKVISSNYGDGAFTVGSHVASIADGIDNDDFHCFTEDGNPETLMLSKSNLAIGFRCKPVGALIITKVKCHICGTKTDRICERCDQYFCDNCQAAYNQFTQIDYDCCEYCANNHRE